MQTTMLFSRFLTLVLIGTTLLAGAQNNAPAPQKTLPKSYYPWRIDFCGGTALPVDKFERKDFKEPVSGYAQNGWAFQLTATYMPEGKPNGFSVMVLGGSNRIDQDAVGRNFSLKDTLRSYAVGIKDELQYAAGMVGMRFAYPAGNWTFGADIHGGVAYSQNPETAYTITGEDVTTAFTQRSGGDLSIAMHLGIQLHYQLTHRLSLIGSGGYFATRPTYDFDIPAFENEQDSDGFVLMSLNRPIKIIQASVGVSVRF